MYEKLKSKRFTAVLAKHWFFFTFAALTICVGLCIIDDAVLNQTQRVLKVIDQNQ